MRSRHLLLSSVLAFLIAPLLQAQESRWENLAQIQPGTKVQVVEKSLKSTSGKFVGFSDTSLTLDVDKKEVVIPQNQVYRLSIPGKNRKRNALTGLAVGAGLGLAMGFAIRNNFSSSERAAAVAGITASYAGIGTGIGAILPASKTVYRAEPPKQARVQEQSHRE